MPTTSPATAEEQRLTDARERRAPWRLWGPYLSERQWGTVREDYSAGGTAWEYLPHDHARSRAYRWGEDGIAGICDDQQQLCFALALWNGADPILKERMFGLTGNEGNHGEDVKEYYFYLDNVPSHAYMKYLYKYPQRAFPVRGPGARRTRGARAPIPEYELLDTGIFDDDRYFDVVVEYAKASPTDILVRISATNRAAHAAPLHLLPTLWFKNDWSWTDDPNKPHSRSRLKATTRRCCTRSIARFPPYWLYCEPPREVLFTENESNAQRLWNVPNAQPYVKDAFHEYVVNGRHDAVNPARTGTKAVAPLRFHGRGRRDRDGATALVRGRAAGAPLGPGSMRSSTRASRRPTRSTSASRRSTSRRHAQRPAPGVRGHAVEQAVLPLHGRALARRRPRGARRRLRRAGRAATTTGGTCRRPTCCRCPTNGNTRGSPRGTWRSRVERHVPRREPRVLPLVRHRQHVGRRHVPPVVVAAAPARRGRLGSAGSPSSHRSTM